MHADGRLLLFMSGFSGNQRSSIGRVITGDELELATQDRLSQLQ